MSILITRRTVVLGALATTALRVSRADADPSKGDIETRLAEIEASVKGHLGVGILDTKTGAFYGRRVNERFPLCSTFKFLAAAMILERVDRGVEQLDRRITFTKSDLAPYSAVTKNRTGAKGMTLGELCAAAIAFSDNTASNLMLSSLGGPKALTQFLRSLGDKATRVDRLLPAASKVSPGDPRDGTTPRAMAYTTQRLLFGNVLSKASETQLIDWLVSSQTGDARLRAGLPKDWRVGDKTGTCSGATNDVAVIWPPDRPPIIIAAYLNDTNATAAKRDAALADVARVAATLV
ncbi:MAG: class A beta-lactamase [Porticoccaceae bacterium]|nr:class A beta-lactamase [Porticoccaceae bacterium]